MLPQCLNVGEFNLRGGDGLVATQIAKKVFPHIDTIFLQTLEKRRVTL